MCASDAWDSTPSAVPPANGLEPVYVCMREGLAKLTHTLLELFTKDKMRTTIESTYLVCVMLKLRAIDDTRIGECIADELVPEILDLAEKLATGPGYYENRWADQIQRTARSLHENIDRVKHGKLGKSKYSSITYTYTQAAHTHALSCYLRIPQCNFASTDIFP